MKNITKYTAVFGLAASLALGLAGCGSAATTEASSKSASTSASSASSEAAESTGSDLNTATSLNVAIQPVTGYVPLYIVRDQGWLEEALTDAGYDIDVTYTEFESGPPENESFASGQQDVGVMGSVPALSGIAAGQDRVLIGVAYNGEKTVATVTTPDSGITSLEDLRGKKIGLVIGSYAENLLSDQLESVGISYDEVELVNLSTAEQQAALESGQIDAVSVWEPTLTKLKNNIGAVVVADGTGLFLAENPIIANREYAEQNPEIVKIFLEQYQRAVEEVQNNPEEVAASYAEQFGLSEEDFVSALANAQFPGEITDADIEDLQGTVDFLYNSGLITDSFDVADYVRTIE